MAKDIEIKVKLDTSGAQEQLKDAVQDLENNPIDIPINIPVEGSIAQLKALKRELKNTAAGSEEFKKLFNQIDDLEEQIGAANKASSDWIDTLAGAGGSLGALGQGLNKGKEAFSSFNNILKTSIIGIIVTAITLLYQAFNKNKEAQDKLKPVLLAFDKILGGLFRAAEPLLDIFVSLAEKALPIMASAISNVAAFVGGLVKGFGALGTAIKELFSGNLSNAIEAAKGSGKAFSDGFNETKNKFVAGQKELTDAEKEEAEKRKAEAEKAAEKRKQLLEKQAADAKRIKDKELADEKKRLEELEKLQLESDKNTEKQRTDNLAAIDAATELVREKQVGAQQAEIDKVNDKYFQLLEIANQFGQDTSVLLEAQRIEQQAINDKYDKKAKDSQQDLLDELEKMLEDDAKAQKEIDDKKQAAKDAAFNAGKNTLNQAAELLGESTAAGKTAAVASATINTYEAATAAYASLAGIPIVGPALGAVAAGVAVAAGIANVKKILAVKTAKGGGGSAPSGGATGGGASASLTPNVNLIGNSNKNANTNLPPTISNNINNNLTVRAVVSETEITQTQQFVKKAEESAKI